MELIYQTDPEATPIMRIQAPRLDVFVQTAMPRLSRAFVHRLCDDGKITVDGKVVTKSGYKLREGDTIVIDYDDAQLDEIPHIDLPVLYEDDDCVVINKPVGVLTHSKGAFNPEGTVATFMRDKLQDMDGNRAGIVHRLDRATSGVIICAKNTEALSFLQKQFSQRKVKKAYIAAIEGTLEPAEAIIDMPIERNPKAPATFRVGPNGKHATTHYKVIQTGARNSLLELKPETGRTHQLRVHLAHVGHPIIGDPLYNGKPADRLYLHALSLEITLPNRERKVFEAPLPADFAAIMK
jgi:23S rRNA pseudouridine1911/1915/1917 synthase